MLGAQPPPAHTLEQWDALSGHADVTQLEGAVLRWLEFLPLVFADDGSTDMSLLIVDFLEVTLPALPQFLSTFDQLLTKRKFLYLAFSTIVLYLRIGQGRKDLVQALAAHV